MTASMKIVKLILLIDHFGFKNSSFYFWQVGHVLFLLPKFWISVNITASDIT